MLFVIIGKGDRPIFELDVPEGTSLAGSSRAGASPVSGELGGLTFFPKVDGVKRDDNNYLSHFVVHGSLDVVDEMIWKNQQMFV
jgi:hypothetical protein